MEHTQNIHARVLVIAFALTMSAALLFFFLRVPAVSQRQESLSVSDTEVQDHAAAPDSSGVQALADINQDGNVSENEALLLTLGVAEAFGQPYESIRKYDMNADGTVDSADTTIIFSALDVLAP